MQRHQPRTHLSPSRPEDSWIEVSGSDEEGEEQEEIITSGLRIRRPRLPHQRHPTYQSEQQRSYHHNLAETILIDSAASIPSSSSSARAEESEEDGEGEDVASFLASQPLSDSESSTDGVASEDDTEEEEEEGLVRPVFAEKARLEMEHDAALRASLSTLLSCAAAARGANAHVQRERIEGLRVVQGVSPPATTSASVSQSVSSDEGRSKRKSGRKPRREDKSEVLRTTLITLAFSAGAIVLLSAVSFSAGYWVRRLEGGGGGRVVGGVRRAKGVRVV